MKRGLASVALVALLLSAPAASADPAEGGNAAAEALFQDARRLADAKKFSEACPKFLQSHKLSPALGTLLNLADCYEKNAQVASAWARFHEAIALAQRQNRPDREKTARERADRLEPRLIRVTFNSKTPDIELRIDGEGSLVGTPVPIDPGKHKLVASARGKKPFALTFEIEDRPSQPPIEIPALENEPEKTRSTSVEPRTGPAGPPPEPRSRSANTMRVIGVVAMGVGLGGIGVGTVFGLRTFSLWSDAEERCVNLACDRAGFEAAADAEQAGNVSTVAFLAGGALFAGGAALFLLAPSKKVHASVGPGTVLVGGTF